MINHDKSINHEIWQCPKKRRQIPIHICTYIVHICISLHSKLELGNHEAQFPEIHPPTWPFLALGSGAWNFQLTALDRRKRSWGMLGMASRSLEVKKFD